MYITQTLHRQIQRAADDVAIVDGALRWTWSELGEHVARFAGAMQTLGVERGDRIAILARNGAPFVQFILGTLWAGAVINPINLRWTADEMAWSLVDCDSRILVIAPEFEHLLPEIAAKAPCLRHVLSIGSPATEGPIDKRTWLDPAPLVPDALRQNDDLAAILYTGGTTGRPKGVMLSHANIICSALGTLANPGSAPHGVFLHSAPLFHIGAISGLMIAMFGGSRSVWLPAFEPLAVLEAVAVEQVTDLFLVPTMLRMVIDHPRFPEFDTTSVKGIRYGAAPIDDTLLDRVMHNFPDVAFTQAYGMTELSPACCLLGPADHTEEARRQGRGRSAGRATIVCEVRIVDGEDRELPRGEVGEIAVRGPTVMLGYWNLPEETAHAVRGGWMHTGDLGRMDEVGYVTVVDRLKDMIITGAENVYSAEVENVVSTHPSVAAVAVIGLPHELWGESVHAVIVPRPGMEADRAAIEAHCRASLASYKIPRSMEFVAALPLSPAGKVLKTVLREERVSLAAQSKV